MGINKRDFLKCAASFILAASDYPFKAFSIDYNLINKIVSMSEEFQQTGNSHPAMYYSKHELGVQCHLCPNECVIKEGKMGLCRTRVNQGNRLVTMAWSNPCAVNIDPIEKKPLYHFLPGSDSYSIAIAGCNLACLNCQNWTISQVSPTQTRNYNMPPEMVVDNAIKTGCKSIAYTYSDPVAFYEYTIETAKIAKLKGLRNVLVSAGYINSEPLLELCKYIHAANIDLKSFSDDVYKKLNSGRLQPVLDSLRTFHEAGVWLEITNLIVPTWTDNLDMIRKMCKWLAVNGLAKYPLHFSRFFPMYKLTSLPPTPAETLETARNIAMAEGMRYVYTGNIANMESSHTYCPKCKKMLIKRKGFSVLENHLKGSQCGFCGQKIDGVWN